MFFNDLIFKLLTISIDELPNELQYDLSFLIAYFYIVSSLLIGCLLEVLYRILNKIKEPLAI
jgi:hypothetical protein